MINEKLAAKELDSDGFLKEMSTWSRDKAHELAKRNDIGPLTENHWEIIEFVRDYYLTNGTAPPVVKIGRELDMKPTEICDLFPCGVARGAYRLAGLPKPPGCL